MHIVYNNTKIYYYITKSDLSPVSACEAVEIDEKNNNPSPKNTDFIVFLHGWGAGSEVMKPLARLYGFHSRLPPKNSHAYAENLTSPPLEGTYNFHSRFSNSKFKIQNPQTLIQNSKFKKRRLRRLKKASTHKLEKAEFASLLRFSRRKKRAERYIFIDFPPFGGSGEPAESWGIEDYAAAVMAVLRAEKVEKIKIIAHSFGGRVAILLAGVYNIVDEMILVGGAGLKMRKSPLVRLKIASYKLAKRIGLRVRRAGSAEYRALSPIMRQTFVRVVNRDLAAEARRVYCPVRLIYGLNDAATPPYLARRLHSLLPRSVLFFVKSAGHYTWLK